MKLGSPVLLTCACLASPGLLGSPVCLSLPMILIFFTYTGFGWKVVNWKYHLPTFPWQLISVPDSREQDLLTCSFLQEMKNNRSFQSRTEKSLSSQVTWPEATPAGRGHVGQTEMSKRQKQAGRQPNADWTWDFYRYWPSPCPWPKLENCLLCSVGGLWDARNKHSFSFLVTYVLLYSWISGLWRSQPHGLSFLLLPPLQLPPFFCFHFHVIWY